MALPLRILTLSVLAILLILSCAVLKERAEPELAVIAVLLGGGALVALGWFGVGPAFVEILDRSPDGNAASMVLRGGTVVIGLAVLIFVLWGRANAQWFAWLGDYFGPVFSVIALIVLASALGLQRKDLDSTRKSLLLVERQIQVVEQARRYADTAAIVMKTFDLVGSQTVKGEIEAGGAGPCFNVCLTVYLPHEQGALQGPSRDLGRQGQPLFRRRFGLVLQDKEINVKFQPLCDDAFSKAKAAQRLVLGISWENLHRTSLGYCCEYRRGGGGRWEPPEEILFDEPEPVEVRASEQHNDEIQARLASGLSLR